MKSAQLFRYIGGVLGRKHFTALENIGKLNCFENNNEKMNNALWRTIREELSLIMAKETRAALSFSLSFLADWLRTLRLCEVKNDSSKFLRNTWL